MDLNEAQKQGKLFLSDFLDFLEALGPWFISWSADDQSQLASQLARGDSHHCTGTACDQFILSMSPMVEWYSRLFSEWYVQPFLCCKFYHLDLMLSQHPFERRQDFFFVPPFSRGSGEAADSRVWCGSGVLEYRRNSLSKLAQLLDHRERLVEIQVKMLETIRQNKDLHTKDINMGHQAVSPLHGCSSAPYRSRMTALRPHRSVPDRP